jgi:hypothetical protein
MVARKSKARQKQKPKVQLPPNLRARIETLTATLLDSSLDTIRRGLIFSPYPTTDIEMAADAFINECVRKWARRAAAPISRLGRPPTVTLGFFREKRILEDMATEIARGLGRKQAAEVVAALERGRVEKISQEVRASLSRSSHLLKAPSEGAVLALWKKHSR